MSLIINNITYPVNKTSFLLFNYLLTFPQYVLILYNRKRFTLNLGCNWSGPPAFVVLAFEHILLNSLFKIYLFYTHHK